MYPLPGFDTVIVWMGDGLRFTLAVALALLSPPVNEAVAEVYPDPPLPITRTAASGLRERTAVAVAAPDEKETEGGFMKPAPPFVTVMLVTDRDPTVAVAAALAPPPPENATDGDEVKPVPALVIVTEETVLFPIEAVAVAPDPPPPENVTDGAVSKPVPAVDMVTDATGWVVIDVAVAPNPDPPVNPMDGGEV